MTTRYNLTSATSKRPHRLAVLMLLCGWLAGCLGVPDDVTVVETFEINRYLGTWYEIARLDHRFERGLSHVTANYSLREDGGVTVINRGFNTDKQQWSEATGKAFMVADHNIGRLKVSFFGPFYGAYNIVALDAQHDTYSMVVGPNRNYLWILSRTPQLPKPQLDALITRAEALGFNTQELIFPVQTDPPQ